LILVQTLQISYEKNGFAEISKNLVKYTDLIIILSIKIIYQNNYIRRSSVMGNVAKNFDFL